ncbi:protein DETOXIFICATION 33-like [Aristolochia californica]|uniref:protein DETOXIFICATION 33-like n=1 Tax=Aristolochia californica TaxID=171875 RepID=UPI0035E2A0B5
MGLIVMAVLLSTRDHFPLLFINSSDVAKEVSKLSSLLAVVLNGLQPVLSGKIRNSDVSSLVLFLKSNVRGVAIGAGCQSLVAYINIACYLLGIRGGILGGIILQTLVLIVVTSRTNWKKEAA